MKRLWFDVTHLFEERLTNQTHSPNSLLRGSLLEEKNMLWPGPWSLSAMCPPCARLLPAICPSSVHLALAPVYIRYLTRPPCVSHAPAMRPPCDRLLSAASLVSAMCLLDSDTLCFRRFLGTRHAIWGVSRIPHYGMQKKTRSNGKVIQAVIRPLIASKQRLKSKLFCIAAPFDPYTGAARRL